MSGGRFEYIQYRLTEPIEDIDRLIETNDSKEIGDYDIPVGRGYSDETIAEFRRGLAIIKQAQVYMQRIDWLVSDDDGEGRFHERLAEELAEILESEDTQ